MPVSMKQSQLIYDALNACDVQLVSALPETWLVHLIRMAEDDPETTLVRLAKEVEGVGISAGAHLAGAKSAMLMQCHGFLTSINGIVSLAHVATRITKAQTLAESSLSPVALLLGRVPSGAWVLLRTVWAKRTDPKDSFNADETGAHMPGFHQEASLLLAAERDVLGVSIETVGTDAGQAGTFNPPSPNHVTMHGHGKSGLTSLCNLDQPPPTGAVVIAAPLKIVDGSGSPVRVLAIVEG